jgi:uncharacterized membrane protein YeiH
MDLQAYFAQMAAYLTSGVGNFLIIDLIAATTNALNGALLAQRPDYYRGRQWTLVGIIILAIFGGIGGGSARDIIAGKLPPSSWMNPWYLILCVLAAIVGMLTAYGKGQNFRETWFQFMTAFSLPWYAAMGVHVGLQVGMPPIACIALGVVGPTTGRFLIDVIAGKSAKQFIRGEWFVGTAVLTSVVYLACAQYLGMSIWPATLISFVVGFVFRVAALWFAWEEPMPRHIPQHVVGEVAPRESLKVKMQPGWEEPGI